MNEDAAELKIDHTDLAKKDVKKNEITVGEYPQSTGWKDKLAKLFSHKKTIAAGAAAAAIAATGTGDDIVNTADKITDTLTGPVEALMPDVSSEFTTPKEVLRGSVDIHIDGELNGRRQPNTEGEIVDWKGIRLVTSDFDPDQNMNIEKLIDLSDKEGFSVENPLIVLAQDPDGGAQKARWLKLPAEGKDGDRFDVYVSISSQTFPHVELKGTDFVGIKSKEMDGVTAYLPENEGEELPNGQFNHIRTLTPAQE